MKKLLLSALVLGGLGLASCEKEQSTPAEHGMATVTFNMYANYDRTNDTLYDGTTFQNGFPVVKFENLDGIDVEFIVDSEDLVENPDPSYNYDKLVYRATANNGVVTIDLPAAKEAHNVEVKFSDVELQKKTKFVSTLSGNDTIKTEAVIYSKSNGVLGNNIRVWDGANIIEDVYYN